MKTNQVMEVWKDVPGYNGLYQISSHGRVLSLARNVPIYLEGSVNKKGYKRVCFHLRPNQKHELVHRLVAYAFIPNPNGFNEINHKNGNKLDNRVENLEWCSAKYNSWHKYNILQYKVKDETKRKLSEIKLGVKLSEEHIRKIADGHKGLKRSTESVLKTAKGHFKKVAQFNNELVLLNTFESLKDAANKTNTNISCISMVCNGRQKSANGYIWKFI